MDEEKKPLREKLEEFAEEAGDAIKKGIHQIGEKINLTKKDASEFSEDYADEVKNTWGEAKNNVKNFAQDVSDKTQEYAQDISAKTQDYSDDEKNNVKRTVEQGNKTYGSEFSDTPDGLDANALEHVTTNTWDHEDNAYSQNDDSKDVNNEEFGLEEDFDEFDDDNVESY